MAKTPTSAKKKAAARKPRKQLRPPKLSVEEKNRIKNALRMPDGRPTMYTAELGQEIAQVLSSDPTAISDLCRDTEHWPADITIRAWEDRYPEFAVQLKHARQCRADLLMDRAVEETTALKIRDKFGSNENRKRNMMNGLAQAHAQRLSRDWAAKSQHEVAGPGGEEPVGVDYTNMSTEKLRLLRKLQKEAMGVSGS